jgi:hypothetical protein
MLEGDGGEKFDDEGVREEEGRTGSRRGALRIMMSEGVRDVMESEMEDDTGIGFVARKEGRVSLCYFEGRESTRFIV